jgi:ketosteroid isomerase-like protein
MRFQPIAIVLIASIAIACSRAEAPSPGPDTAAAPDSPESVEKIVNAMEQSLALGLMKGDAAAIDGVLADDFVATLPDGSSATKAKLIDDLKSGAVKVQTIVLEPITVRVFGDTAIATYTQTEKSTYSGRDISARTMWTDVFVKRNGRWQMVAEHGNQPPTPRP